jgi:hypothetical protein
MAAPTAITVQQMKGPFDAVVATGFDFTWAASTLTDGDTFVCTGRELLLVQNTTAGALTITVTSTPDDKGRSGDITSYSVGANGFSVIPVGLTTSAGFRSSAGTIRITCSAITLKVAVLRLPAGYPN